MSGQQGREVVIVEAVRTPIGRGHPEKGYYKDTHPNELLGTCFTELIERAGHRRRPRSRTSSPAACSRSASRAGTSRATRGCRPGLPIETAATTVDRQCGSAQQAVNFGAALIAAGIHDVVIGSGVEHMGHIPMGVGFQWTEQVGSPLPPALMEKHDARPAGPERRDDRRAVGDPALRARRARRALAPPRAPARPRRAASSARSSRSRPTATTRYVDQGIRPDTNLETLAHAEAGVQARRPDHRGDLVADLRRRRGGAAHVAREGRRSSAARRARGSSTRRRSASTR